MSNLKIADKLRSSGLRPTRQRIEIAEFLFNREKTFHFTVEDLDKLINIKIRGEKISLATFYNTVHAFKKADTNINTHHHFFDSKNNILTDIESNKIQLTNIPPPPSGKKIKNIEVVINIDNDSH